MSEAAQVLAPIVATFVDRARRLGTRETQVAMRRACHPNRWTGTATLLLPPTQADARGLGPRVGDPQGGIDGWLRRKKRTAQWLAEEKARIPEPLWRFEVGVVRKEDEEWFAPWLVVPVSGATTPAIANLIEDAFIRAGEHARVSYSRVKVVPYTETELADLLAADLDAIHRALGLI